MLDDDEFRQAMTLRGTGTGDMWEREFGPVLREYERITGYHETNINAFYHHVTSLYGPFSLGLTSRASCHRLGELKFQCS